MSEPIQVTKTSFADQVLRSDVPVVVDFWAPWCGPCRMIGPVLDRLAGAYEGQVKVAKVNVDLDPELAGAFRISGIPTLMVFEGGDVIHRESGFRGAGALEHLFEHLAADAGAADEASA